METSKDYMPSKIKITDQKNIKTLLFPPLLLKIIALYEVERSFSMHILIMKILSIDILI